MAIEIIDTHQHLWDLDRVEYAWLTPEFGVLYRTYTAAELEPQLAPAGVTYTVMVQSANNYEDTEFMFEQVEAHDWMVGVVGWVPLLRPDEAAQAVERFKKNPYFKGVRHLIHNEPDPRWLLQPQVIDGLKILAANNLTFDVVATLPEHMECIPVIGEKIPELKMVIDHLGQPPIPSGGLGRWADDLKAAAENPRVYAKISGLGTTSGNFEGWQADDLKPYIDYAIETFGPQRCMCGGDWPVSVLAGGYVKAWQAYRQVLAGRPVSEQEQILNSTARDFYRLTLPG